MFSAEPVCSWAAYPFATRLRDRGCSAHPVFPTPSSLSEGTRNGKLRASCAARTRAHVSQRHGEGSDAIQQAAERKTGLLRFARNDGGDDRVPLHLKRSAPPAFPS